MIQVNGVAGASPTPRGGKKSTGSAVNGGGIDNFEGNYYAVKPA